MATTAPVPAPITPGTYTSVLDSKIKRTPGRVGAAVFGLALVAGAIYAGSQLVSDLSGVHLASSWPFVLLGLALAIALGFEFVNGFHDTANAVATVIYTHTLEPHMAVVWSGLWNFVGVLTSTGAVAFGVVSLLPVELILRVGTGAGFAMIFALLIAAIVWNLVTWYFGLPNSSSHTLIGSILGVGLMNQMMEPRSGLAGVDWGQALNVGKSLLFSPILGFIFSALLLFVLRLFVKNRKLYEEPKGNQPPPFWIRCLLFLTCTGVSFAHGSNDGQKGMGLIMLILIGTVPTAYALNHAVANEQVQSFIAISEKAERTLEKYDHGAVPVKVQSTAFHRGGQSKQQWTTAEQIALERVISQRKVQPDTAAKLSDLIEDISQQVAEYPSLAAMPPAQSRNVRNEMYVASETLRVMEKTRIPALSPEDTAALSNYKKQVDHATKFIPDWVKVAVALALGLGTMVGWKRIVITVGERIGKQHLTYAQGASAELIAMGTILAADRFGLPVSTTHVLTSGVAGTMAANGAGLQWGTIRALIAAWLLTLPISIALAGGLYWLFRHVF
jgi:PiT family inorganic phosphate transporter